jgi:hypothetical protein
MCHADRPDRVRGQPARAARAPVQLRTERRPARPQVEFQARGAGYHLFLTRHEAVLSSHQADPERRSYATETLRRSVVGGRPARATTSSARIRRAGDFATPPPAPGCDLDGLAAKIQGMNLHHGITKAPLAKVQAATLRRCTFQVIVGLFNAPKPRHTRTWWRAPKGHWMK